MIYYISLIINRLIDEISTLLVKFCFRLNNVHYNNDVSVSGMLFFKKHPLGKFYLGTKVRLNSGIRRNPFGGEGRLIISIGKDAELKIGNNVGISNASIHCYKEIIIEDDVFIGGGVKIFDTDFHSINYNDRIQKPDLDVKYKPILIKKGAFIGGYCIIGKGVIIGERSVIGAGSVIKNNIPNDQIWSGNPAKYIKSINT